MPFLVHDYLIATVVLPELICGKSRLKITAYRKFVLLINKSGSDKRDLRGIKVKINIFREKERTGFDEHFMKI